MQWQFKIFLHMNPIKSHHGATLNGLFLKYLNKCLHVMIWLDACAKKCYTVGAHKLNPLFNWKNTKSKYKIIIF
jgi:hypothetical protein